MKITQGKTVKYAAKSKLISWTHACISLVGWYGKGQITLILATVFVFSLRK